MEKHLKLNNLPPTKWRVSPDIAQRVKGKGLFLYQQENRTIYLDTWAMGRTWYIKESHWKVRRAADSYSKNWRWSKWYLQERPHLKSLRRERNRSQLCNDPTVGKPYLLRHSWRVWLWLRPPTNPVAVDLQSKQRKASSTNDIGNPKQEARPYSQQKKAVSWGWVVRSPVLTSLARF